MPLTLQQLFNQAETLNKHLAGKADLVGLTASDLLSLLYTAAVLLESSLSPDVVGEATDRADQLLECLFCSPKGDPC